MKAVQKTLLAVMLAATANHAFAAGDSVDVRVIGQIVPAACTPALSGGATIDYGTIKAETIAKDDFTILPVKSLNFTLTCEAAAKVALTSAVDSRSGTAVNPVGKSLFGRTIVANTTLMGLGQADGKNIGSYAMLIDGASTKLDGTTTPDSIVSSDVGMSWVKAAVGDVWLGANKFYLYSWANAGELEPVAFTTLTGTLKVQAAINKGSELDLTKAVTLDGMSSVQVYYL